MSVTEKKYVMMGLVLTYLFFGVKSCHPWLAIRTNNLLETATACKEQNEKETLTEHERKKNRKQKQKNK